MLLWHISSDHTVSKELYLKVTCLDSNNLWIFMIVVTGLQERKEKGWTKPLAQEYSKRHQSELRVKSAGRKGDDFRDPSLQIVGKAQLPATLSSDVSQNPRGGGTAFQSDL